jgi:hypothetical protein
MSRDGYAVVDSGNLPGVCLTVDTKDGQGLRKFKVSSAEESGVILAIIIDLLITE